MSLAEVAVPKPPIQVTGEKYADVFEAAQIVGLPVVVVLWLTEAGTIPAQSLRERGVACWKFKLRDLERVRADIDAVERLLLERDDGVDVIQ